MAVNNSVHIFGVPGWRVSLGRAPRGGKGTIVDVGGVRFCGGNHFDRVVERTQVYIMLTPSIGFCAMRHRPAGPTPEDEARPTETQRNNEASEE